MSKKLLGAIVTICLLLGVTLLLSSCTIPGLGIEIGGSTKSESVDATPAPAPSKDETKTEEKKFTITWQNEDGTVIKTEQVREGSTPYYSTYSDGTPAKAESGNVGYIFKGWTPDITAATADATYTATYIEASNAVAYVLNNGSASYKWYELLAGNYLGVYYNSIRSNDLSKLGEGVLTIPDDADVHYIDTESFRDCTSLKGIVLPNTLTTINARAFRDAGLKSDIVIPTSVTKISDAAFNGCSFTNLWYNGTITEWNAINFDTGFSYAETTTPAYRAANIYFKDEDGAVEHGGVTYTKIEGVVTLPETMTTVNRCAFCGFKAVTEFVFPDTCENIYYMAFAECDGLETVVLPNSVKIVGECAFKGCSSLTSLTLSTGMTELYSYSFCYCVNLATVNIPSSIIKIGSDTFTALETANFGVTYGWAYYDVVTNNKTEDIPASTISNAASAANILGRINSLTYMKRG